jgi:ADP-ribosylglycohydrolase
MTGFVNIKNKTLGVLFGSAIGDALGLATEFMSKQQAHESYPDGVQSYSDIIRDRHRSRWEIGDWTDDTDQMLCILDAIVEQKEVNTIRVAEKIYGWFRNGGMGVGSHTYRVLNFPEYAKYPHETACLAWEFSGKNLASNGGVMRTSVLGIYRYWDWGTVKSHSEEICKITHYDPRCVASCVIVDYVISRELLGLPVTKSALLELASTYDERVLEYIELAYQPDLSALQLDEKDSMGYTLKTLAVALWAYNHCEIFSDTLQRIIMEGGDADTNGAVAGALMGAKLGFEAIPVGWVNGLKHRDVLLERAMLLVELNEPGTT